MMPEQDLKAPPENILITLSDQYHLIRLLKGRGGNGPVPLPRPRHEPRQLGDRARNQKIEEDLEV